MDAMPGADEVIIQLLQQLVEQGRTKRAEGVLQPPMEAPTAPAPGGEEEEMAALEAMLADESAEAGAPPSSEEGDFPPPKKKSEDEDELE